MRALVVVAALAWAGCPKREGKEATSPCGASAAEVAALRDGDGTLVRALRGRDPIALCSPTGSVTGFIRVNHEIATPSGAVRARVTREGDADVTVTGTPALRLHDENGELRVLRADGVPLGSISKGGDEGPLATVFDAGGRAIATVEAHHDGVAIRAPDGTTRALLRPRPPVDDARLAGLAAIPGLSPDDAIALAWAFPRPVGHAR